MKKFHLDIYKETRQYLYLFDVLMKDEIINKDYFLADLGINPGSYRRAKVSEQKIGKEIVEILSRKFNLKLIESKEVDELEELVNDIFYEINYKNYDNFEYNTNIVLKRIQEKNILYPIYLLLNLFLLINSKKDVQIVIDGHKDMYNEIQKYKKFYNEDLMDIFDLLELTFSTNLTKQLISKKRNNGISYSIISFYYYSKKSYYESLYFALKAKEIFKNENNYKRMIYINITLLNNLSFTLDFDEYNKLAYEQLHSLKSLGFKEEYEINITFKHLVISYIALENYREVIRLLSNKQKMNITELFCLIISKFNYEKNSFDSWYNEVCSGIKANEKYKNLLTDLISYLNTPDKKNLAKLKDYEIMNSLINVLNCS